MKRSALILSVVNVSQEFETGKRFRGLQICRRIPRQYNFDRSPLITFAGNAFCIFDFLWQPLFKVCDIATGNIPNISVFIEKIQCSFIYTYIYIFCLFLSESHLFSSCASIATILDNKNAWWTLELYCYYRSLWIEQYNNNMSIEINNFHKSIYNKMLPLTTPPLILYTDKSD